MPDKSRRLSAISPRSREFLQRVGGTVPAEPDNASATPNEWVIAAGSRSRFRLPTDLALLLDVRPGDQLRVTWCPTARLVLARTALAGVLQEMSRS